ncbi:MAG TPA: caspase family protein [Pyrinomonadaceae bacterium]|jgi:hypothetical protein
MKSRPKLFRLALLATALSLGLALAPPRRSAARQSEGLRRGVVGIRVEGGKELKLYEQSYALVVGVSEYTRGWPRLPGVKRDVEEVSRALERHGFLVTKVENPDSAQLEKSFKEFIDAYGRGVETRLLFYFAGHGHTVKQSYGEEMGYIVPADAPLPARDPAGFMSKAMDMQQMELYARRVQSKHALFLFDSCFSGALFALSRAVPESITYKTARPVRQFITSGSADEQVPDQSIFRRQFVEALDGEGDVNGDGYVTGTELGEFLQDKVINYSRNAQHPQYGKIRNPNLDKGDFVFALPKAPLPQPPPAAVPSPAAVDPAALELSFWDSIKNGNDPEDFKEYLDKYPGGQFAGIARRRIASLNSPAPSLDAKPAFPEVFAVVNGREITLKDFNQEGRDKINQQRGRIAEAERNNSPASDLRAELYRLEKAAADLAINDLLLNDEAQRRNVTPKALLQAETAGKARPISDAEVRDFYEKNKERINGEFGAVRAQIKEYLAEMERLRLEREFADRLRAQATIKILLAEPAGAGKSP